MNQGIGPTVYEKQVAHYQCALSVIWKNGNEMGVS